MSDDPWPDEPEFIGPSECRVPGVIPARGQEIRRPALMEAVRRALAMRDQRVWLCVACTMHFVNEQPTPTLVLDDSCLACHEAEIDCEHEQHMMREFSSEECAGCGSVLAGQRFPFVDDGTDFEAFRSREIAEN